jgi:Predicted membrane protein (DUF2306)
VNTAAQTAPAASPARYATLKWSALITLCLIAAAAAIRRIVALLLPHGPAPTPQLAALDAAFAAHRGLTLLHIIPALACVAIIPFWFSRSVRQNPTAHRRVTLAFFLTAAITGLTALPLTLRPIGGINESAASILFDGLFLFSLARAWLFFRRDNASLHRAWMIRAIAVLLGIATTRPVMGIFFATSSLTHLQPQQFFGTAFWIGFTTTYIAGEAYLRAFPVSSTK